MSCAKRIQKRVAAVLAFVVLLTVLPSVEAVDYHPAYLKRVNGMHDSFVQLEAAWYRLLMGLPDRDAAGGAKVLRLTLSKALFRYDLDIEAIRWDGTWLPGRAWCTPISSFPQRIVVQRFAIERSGRRPGLSGSLAIELERGDGWDRDMAAEQDFGTSPRIPGRITIQAHSGPDGFTGTFRIDPVDIPNDDESAPPDRPMNTSRGVLRGALLDLDAALQPRHSAPPPAWKKDSVYRLYATAQWTETLAQRRYRGIRALALARTRAMPYAAALKECRERLAVRYPLNEPATRTKLEHNKRAPTLDELVGDDLGLDMEDAAPVEKKKPDSGKDPEVAKAVGHLDAMAAHLAAIVGVVRRYEQRKDAEPPAVAKDSLDTGDPDFGPWYGEGCLPFNSAGRRHRLPEDAGQDGPQDWVSVGNWDILGPFSLPRWDMETPLLPDAIFDLTASYRVDRERMQKASAVKASRNVAWQAVSAWTSFGYIVPPDWSKQNRYSSGTSAGISGQPVGIEHSSFYAVTEIESPRDVELWAAVGTAQRAKLWIDDELCWEGPSKVDEALLQDTALIKLRLHGGVNRLLLRCDVHRSSPFFWMRVCTRGRPRDAADAEAHRERVARARRAIPELSTSGYRGNLTGRFPHARTPAAWNYKSGENVRWFAPLPYWSNASPALARDRLFVAMEPHWLVCMAKDDGRVLWKRAVTVIDLLGEPDKKEGWRLYKAWWKARRERDALPQHMERPHKWLGYSHYWADHPRYWEDKANPWQGQGEKDERKDASPEMIALLDKRDELEKAEDPQSVQKELTAVLEQVKTLKEKEGGAGTQEVTTRNSRAAKTWGAFIGFLRKHSAVNGTSGYWYDYDGYAFATPVTDGTNVWWKNGMDAVACFDMEGNRKWMIRMKTGGSQSPTVPSPILLDDMLVIKTPNYVAQETRTGVRYKKQGQRLVALEPDTGKRKWETGGLPKFGMDWTANTPAPLMLTNGKEQMRVLVTSGGSVVRADDGKILVHTMGAFAADSSVVPFGDIVVFPRPHLCAYRIIMVDRDTVGCKLLWMHQMGTHGLGYHGTLVTGDGLVCHETRFGHFYRPWPCETENGPGEDRICLIVKDVVTGEMAAGLQMHRKGASYWSLHSSTADHVFMLGGDTIFRGKSHPKPPHTMTVFTRGRQPVALARNAVDRTYGGPAFDSDRMYIRGYGGVWCVGYTGEEGRAYEARVVAENLLDAISAGPPRGGPEPLVPGVVANPLRKGVHGALAEFSRFASRVENNRAPHTWMMAGPLPATEAEVALAALDGGKKHPRPDQKIGSAANAKPFKLLNGSNFPAKRTDVQLQHQNLTIVDRQRRVIPLGRVIKQAGTASYLYAELKNEKEKVMRFEQKTPGVRAWIGGLPVSDGDRVRFRDGVYGLLVAIRIDSIPPGGLEFSPRFYNSSDPAKELETWCAFVTKNRPYLQRAIDLAPDSPEAGRARTVLAHLSRQAARIRLVQP